MSEPAPKKPILKRWWFWPAAIFGGFALVGAVLPRDATEPPAVKKTDNAGTVQSEAKSSTEADTCDKEIALTNADMLLQDAAIVMSMDLSGTWPRIVIRQSEWVRLSQSQQLGIVATIDCAVSGPGRHIGKIEVVEGAGMEPYAEFDAVALRAARATRPAAISERLK